MSQNNHEDVKIEIIQQTFHVSKANGKITASAIVIVRKYFDEIGDYMCVKTDLKCEGCGFTMSEAYDNMLNDIGQKLND